MVIQRILVRKASHEKSEEHMNSKRYFCYILIAILLPSLGACESKPISTPTHSSATPSAAVETVTPAATGPTASPPPQAIDAAQEPTPATVMPPKQADALSKVPVGIYARAGNSPISEARAEITKKGDGLYHLSVAVFQGLTHHQGMIESDFQIANGQTSMLDPEYSDVSLAFEDNRLQIIYPSDSYHGGINAEPRGDYYLQQADDKAANPFLRKLYDAIGLDSRIRDKRINVHTITADEGKDLLLLQVNDSKIASYPLYEQIVVYHEETRDFQNIGELSEIERKRIADDLKKLGYSVETVYHATRKQEFDRYYEVMMQRFDKGGHDALDMPLTEKEAFYIAMGVSGTTRNENNRRNKDDIGSIFIQEVESSDEKEVTIHVYELVRNDAEDTHTATSNWITVDRRTGKVTDFYE